jgi:hypothetical protein
MRILLDESVPVQVGKALGGHEVLTARGMGWGGFSNGDLLSAAAQERFQVLIIADRNLRHQQNLSDLRLAILELWTNHRPTLERHFLEIRAAVEGISSVAYFVLENPERKK